MGLKSILIIFICLGCLSSPQIVRASPSTCPDESPSFLFNLQSLCPLSISPNLLLEVDGNFLDRVLSSNQRNAYTSVLFYASWCPFSHAMRPKFEMLGFIFPQVEHLAVEQSAILPSVFSRNGIHSLPSILIVNHQTSKVRYSGPKDLKSLVQFYKKTTGLEPVQYFAVDNPPSLKYSEESIMKPWVGSSLKELRKREPSLAFAVLFLALRVLLFVYPKVLSHLKVFHRSFVLPCLNLEIFGETRQLFGRFLHMVDVRRIWTKLRICKTRNFQEGAKNCRVWASSLASVSLGESSSSARSCS